MYQRRHSDIVTPPLGYLPPSSQTQHALSQTWSRYFSPVIWRWVFQYAAQNRYGMRAAAIAHGAALCLLMSCLALLAGASLNPDFKTVLLSGLAQWGAIKVDAIDNLIGQIVADWQPSHCWLLWIVSGGMAVGLWLKLVGTVQQILRTTGQREIDSAISMQKRLTTLFLALASAGLLVLAYGFVFANLPDQMPDTIAEATIWNYGKHLMIQGLRWSLAGSTIALMCGLFYRASLKFSARTQPLLPGTILASVLWIVLSLLLKLQISTLPNHHWLYGILSTTTLLLLGLYLNTMGLLTGGCFNLLLGYYLPKPRSRSVGTPPPPSFESFTIQRRSDRRP